MNISSLLQSNYTSSLSSSTSVRNTQKTQTSEDLFKNLSAKQDTVSISAEGRAYSKMPPPKDIDFSSMSDDDLKSLLESVQEKTGSIPGLEDSENTDVSSLTDEQLQSARDALMEQMKKRMEEMSQYSAMFGATSNFGYSELGEA